MWTKACLKTLASSDVDDDDDDDDDVDYRMKLTKYGTKINLVRMMANNLTQNLDKGMMPIWLQIK